MKAKIKEYWFLPFYALLSVILLVIHPLTGEETVAFPWKTACYLFMLLLTEEGMRKENLALPLFRLLNSVRSTPFLLFVLLSSAFILSLFLFDFMAVIILVPFTLTLLKACRKEKYRARCVAMVTLISGITSLLTPFSTANLYLFLDTDASYSTYMPSLLIPFGISGVIIILEAFLVFRETKGDEIYLHIEEEEYWKGEKRGVRILYTAFFLVILFGRRFNTIDLLLVTVLAYLILDREIFRKFNWALFFTLTLILLSGYTLSRMNTPDNRILSLLFSLILTRLGSVTAGISLSHSLPCAILTVSFPFIFALRSIKEEKKAFVREYVLLSLPHIVLFLLLSLLG